MTLTNCVLASGSLNKDGYKRIRVGNKLWMKHRYEWTKINGDIPKGFELHHTCKNRDCYNVEHLLLISVSEHKSLSNKERAGTGYYKAKRTRDSYGKFI